MEMRIDGSRNGNNNSNNNSSANTGERLPPGENHWTLIWISDRAFKPAAQHMKEKLEALGGQVKSYKTNKNATRALDKKRALTRTVVLVSGMEAPAFLAYIASRPELSFARIVVETMPRTVPIHESALVN